MPETLDLAGTFSLLFVRIVLYYKLFRKWNELEKKKKETSDVGRFAR